MIIYKDKVKDWEKSLKSVENIGVLAKGVWK